MMTWSTSCLDWEERIVNRQSLVPLAPLFPEEAEAALRVFKALKIVDLPGMPTFGEACRPWVFDFVAAIFGSYDAEAGRRLINEFFLLISKKNTKSTIAAGIMVTALIRNWRHYSELNILAPTIEVAKNSADPAMGMVQCDDELLEMLRPVPHQRLIEHRATKATLKIVAADSETVSGKKSAFVLIDELWLFGKIAHAENMLREATGGLASRTEGFVIALSTMSDEKPAGVFRDWLQRFRGIRDGTIIAPRSLGLLYEYPEAMLKAEAFKEPENFYVTNPNLGASVDEIFLLDQLEKDRQKGPKSLVGFYAKHLNVEVGTNLRSDHWAGALYWSRGVDESLTFDDLLRRCELIVTGLDGGGLDDLYGFNALGRERDEVEIETEVEEIQADGQRVKLRKKVKTKRWLSWSHAWCHKGVLERRKSIATVLQDFAAADELTIVNDDLADISEIVDYIDRVKQAGLLYCVVVDPAGLGEMIDALAQIEITEANKEHEWNFVIGARQGFAMMNSIKTAERKLANGTLLHADQSLMDWCVGNVKIEPLATAIRATKQNAGDAKIDPWMAMMNCVSVMQTNPSAGRSVYDQIADGEAPESDEEAQSHVIDMAILNDPRHPRWNEMRERFDRRLAEQDTEEF